MSAVAELLIRILGDATGGKKALDETGQAAEQTGQKADKLKITLQNVARVGLAALSAGLAMGIKSTNELNQHMANFSAQTGMMGEEAEKAKRLVQDLYKVNEDSYQDLVGTITALRTELQASTDEMELYTQGFLDFAKVTGQDDVQAVENLSRVIKAWNLDISDSEEVMDALLAVKRETGAEIVALQQNMAAAAPAMRALGMNWKEGAAYLGMLEAAGIKGQAAVSAFNYATRQVESPEQLRKMIEDMTKIEDPTLRAQAAAEIFGARAGPQMAQAIGQGKIGLHELMAAIEESEGIVSEASAAYDDNFNVKFALYRKQIEGTVQELVEGLGPAITTTASIVTASAAVWPGLAGVVSSAFGAMRTAASGFFTFLMANPVVMIIGLIVIAIAGLYLAWKNNLFGIQDVTKKMVDWIQGVWEAFRKDTADVWDKIRSFLVQWWPYLLGLLGGPVGLLVAFIFKNWDDIKNRTTDTWNGIRDFLRNTADGMRQSTVERVTQLRLDAIRQFEELWSYIKGIPSQAYNWGRDIIQQLWNGIRSIFNSLKSWFDSNVMSMLNKLNPFTRHSPSLVDRVWAGVDEIKRAYQSIGDMRIQPPDIDVPWPSDAPAAPAGAAGTGHVNLHFEFTGPVSIRDDSDIRRTAQELHNLAQEKLRELGSK